MRAQKIFKLSKAEWASKAEAGGIPFYEKVLDKIAAGQAVSQVQLTGIRTNFGVSDARAEDMHAKTYEAVARSLLQPELGAAAKVAERRRRRHGGRTSAASGGEQLERQQRWRIRSDSRQRDSG